MLQEKRALIRLSDFDLKTIIELFKKHFGKDDHLWIFGSRVDPKARGGDIDLYVETLEEDGMKAEDKRREFLFELWDRIGEQKIDIVLHKLVEKRDLSIYKTAKKEGIFLV